MPKKTSASKNAAGRHDRDEAILRDIARYRFLDLASCSIRHGEGKQLGHVMRKMSDATIINAHPRGLPGGLSYWTPSRNGLKQVNINVERSRPLQGVYLDSAIAVRAWCHLNGVKGRARLDGKDAKQLFGKCAPSDNVLHVASVSDAKCPSTGELYPVVLRVYFPSLTASVAETARKVKELLSRLKKSSLSEWISDFDYGLLLLVDSDRRKQDLVETLDRIGVTKNAFTVVDVAPNSKTFSRFIKRRKLG